MPQRLVASGRECWLDFIDQDLSVKELVQSPSRLFLDTEKGLPPEHA